MVKHLVKCINCGKYSIKRPDSNQCDCGGTFRTPHPPRYSPFSKYTAYVRRAKEQASKKGD
ncbi:MAG: nucleolar RNA-binding Nop10p family protein [Candidatus Hodarchaeales archaeon]